MCTVHRQGQQVPHLLGRSCLHACRGSEHMHVARTNQVSQHAYQSSPSSDLFWPNLPMSFMPGRVIPRVTTFGLKSQTVPSNIFQPRRISVQACQLERKHHRLVNSQTGADHRDSCQQAEIGARMQGGSLDGGPQKERESLSLSHPAQSLGRTTMASTISGHRVRRYAPGRMQKSEGTWGRKCHIP